jgi:hypothetical protein
LALATRIVVADTDAGANADLHVHAGRGTVEPV